MSMIYLLLCLILTFLYVLVNTQEMQIPHISRNSKHLLIVLGLLPLVILNVFWSITFAEIISVQMKIESIESEIENEE